MADIVLTAGVRVTIKAPSFAVTMAPPTSSIVTVLPVRGPAGTQGATGPPGVGGIYDHHQISPAATWTITHNLGKYVEPLLLLDDAPARRVLTDVDLPNTNTAVLTFPYPVTGWAHFTS